MPTLIKIGTASYQTVLMTLQKKNDETTHRLPKASEKQISIYVEATNFLLKFIATDSNIAMATSDKVCLKKTLMETSVQFASVLRSKIVRCGSTYSKERTNEVLIDDLPAYIQNAVKMFWSLKQNGHFLEIS